MPALGQSLNEIVRRHESLRTTFGSQGSAFVAEAKCHADPLMHRHYDRHFVVYGCYLTVVTIGAAAR